tara:strand:- start:77 stop:958 length:882 start_codon:yes stop_codon:yes gene_type:complete
MVESNSNNQFYTQYHTPRPTRIQTPRNNVIAHSNVNKQRRDNKAKKQKEWNNVVRRVRARLNPTSVRTQRIKSTPRRVNTKQTPINYNKIVKEAINEANAVKALLNLNRKPDANKEKKVNSMTESNQEKIRKQKREWARKRAASMTEADKEAKRQRKREWYRKRVESMTEANKQKKRVNSMTEANQEKIRKRKREWARKRAALMTEADKEAKRQYQRELYRKSVESMTEANKQKKRVNSMTEADKEKIRKRRREWAKKRVNSMSEADKEAKRQRDRELYRKRREKNLWSYGII